MCPLGGSRAFGCTESSPSHLKRVSEQVERGCSHFGEARTVSGRAHRSNNRRQLGEAGISGQCFLMLRLTTLTPMHVMTHCPQYSILCFCPFCAPLCLRSHGCCEGHHRKQLGNQLSNPRCARLFKLQAPFGPVPLSLHLLHTSKTDDTSGDVAS